jgi:hypothetical protein
MTTWDEGYFKEEVQAFIKFEATLFLEGWA